MKRGEKGARGDEGAREDTRKGLKSIRKVVELVGAVAEQRRDGKGNCWSELIAIERVAPNNR